MNSIEVKITSNEFMNDHLSIFVDSKPLDVYLFELTNNSSIKNLVVPWFIELLNENEEQYLYEILKIESTEGLSIPVLLCPDDLDFSCTVIVAKVRYTEDCVIWDKVGTVKKDNWISENWNDEEMRRLKNYTHRYLNSEENIEWFSDISTIVFGKSQYLKCLKYLNYSR